MLVRLLQQPHPPDRNHLTMRKTLTTLLTAGALLLTACGSSGWSQVQKAGIPIGYGDYHDMCDVYSGEVVRGMNIDRKWTSAQDSELRSIIASDPSCQPEGK